MLYTVDALSVMSYCLKWFLDASRHFFTFLDQVHASCLKIKADSGRTRTMLTVVHGFHSHHYTIYIYTYYIYILYRRFSYIIPFSLPVSWVTEDTPNTTTEFERLMYTVAT